MWQEGTPPLEGEALMPGFGAAELGLPSVRGPEPPNSRTEEQGSWAPALPAPVAYIAWALPACSPLGQTHTADR